tara:strand:+ start:98 stop:418 length:321 start_codon:yes stop_codon:yes gene_type:complete
MKFKTFIRYKNRKLYCKEKSGYVNFNDIIELIRSGYRIGVVPKDGIITDTEAILNGNRYLVKCFANHIEDYSHSTTSLLANFLYDTWQFEKNIEDDMALLEGKCIN